MSELTDLYQEVILDHYRQPRNYGPVEGSWQSARGHNPLCGDHLAVYVKLDGERIEDIRFEGSGCAISKASASMMTQAVKGKSPGEARKVFQEFRAMVTSEPGTPPDRETLGKLAVFCGVCEFPVRVKCATLAWHTLRSALESPGEIVTTE